VGHILQSLLLYKCNGLKGQTWNLMLVLLRVCNDQDSLADRIYCLILREEVRYIKGCHNSNHIYEGISGN
jgi:hypothetical protein